MRKFILLILVVLLALAAVPVYAGSPPNGPPSLDRAIAAQQAHNHHLLATAGVVGTAVGLTADGKAAVMIFTEKERVAGLPDSLDGVPVVVEATGKFTALKGGPATASRRLTTTSSWPRPVPIGISTGNATATDWTTGTIAARVKDAGGNVYALSNNHVYALENKAAINSEVLQPGLYDTRGVYNSSNHLGNLSAFVPLNFSGASNTVDAAIASTTTGLLDKTTPTSLGGYGTPNSTTITGTVGMVVQKFGRTTLLTKGRITAINATVSVGYNSSTALFVNQVIVQSVSRFMPFIGAGDSGSLLVTVDSSCNPVGLLFAGNSSGTLAVANSINSVLSALSVTIDGK